MSDGQIWTLEAFKEYAESRFEGIQREVKLALDAAQTAVTKAETATEKRFDAVNEFRGQLSDQAASFMPRELAEGRLAAIERWQSKLVGAFALAVVLVPVLTGTVVYLLSRK